jgi:hypothetical protein
MTMSVSGADAKRSDRRRGAAKPRSLRIPGSYLVIVRETGLAYAIATALADGQSERGYDVPALVPPLRGQDFTGPLYGRVVDQWRAAHVPAGGRPAVLVALYEEGLYEDLGRLDLMAVVGVRPDEQGPVAGLDRTFTVPVLTIGDFVQAVLDHNLRPVRLKEPRAVEAKPSSRPSTRTGKSRGTRPARRFTIVSATAPSVAGVVLLGSLAGTAALLPSTSSTDRPAIHATLAGYSSSGGSTSSSGGGVSDSSGGTSSSYGGASSSSAGTSSSYGGVSDSYGSPSGSSTGSSSYGGVSISYGGVSSSSSGAVSSPYGSVSNSYGSSSSAGISSPGIGSPGISSPGISSGTPVSSPGSTAGITSPSDGTVVMPDGSIVEPDGTTITADGTVIGPDGQVDNPLVDAIGEGAEAVANSLTVTESDGSVVLPDGTIVEPDGTTVTTDGTVIGPDGQVDNPLVDAIGQGAEAVANSLTVTESDGSVVLPGGNIMEPDGTVVTTEGTIISPDGQVDNPAFDEFAPRYIGVGLGGTGTAGLFSVSGSAAVMAPIPGRGAEDGPIDTVTGGMGSVGVDAGAGPQLVVSNAKNADDLAGVSQGPTISAGGVQAQVGVGDNGVYTLSIGPGAGYSYGVSDTVHSAPVSQDTKALDDGYQRAFPGNDDSPLSPGPGRR